MMQACYLPWLGLFHMWSTADCMIWLDNFQYTKNSFASRNKILNQGKPMWLSVPVQGSLGQTYLEVKPSQQISWQKKHIQSIKQSYAKAPYRHELNDFLTLLETVHFSTLADLNISMLKCLGSKLGISTPTINVSSLSLKYSQRSQKIRDILNEVGGQCYLAAENSVDYMLEDGGWEDSGIEVFFQKFESPSYPQINSTQFVPNLSVVDAIANIGCMRVMELIQLRKADWIPLQNKLISRSG